MGKNTDKLYVTHSEWSGIDGQYSTSTGITKRKIDQPFYKLSFQYCNLSLQPFENPVCYINEANEAFIFELLHIIPYIKKHKKNPITGERLEAKSLLKLNFHKNEDGEYCCPITYKIFNNHSHIVAIKTSGNVFSWDAVNNLNIKAKNMKELLTNEPFTRNDIITIQDPHNFQTHEISKLEGLNKTEDFIVKIQEGTNKELESNISSTKKNITNSKSTFNNEPTMNLVIQNKRNDLSDTKDLKDNPKYSKQKEKHSYNVAPYTTGLAAASFTSTSLTPITSLERALYTDEEYMLIPKRIKTKGYARIQTNLGNINIELNAEWAPKAVYNFIMLAKRGDYKNVIFHRNIKNFMIQGGDPTGTGRGGKSFWEKDFNDEIQGPLSHNQRGILSMANRGKNTNSSQFFITYKETRHLDRKHTIFGKVVGGMETLEKMENSPVDSFDKPISDIIMTDVIIFVDPFEEFKKIQLLNEQKQKNTNSTENDDTTWTGKFLTTNKDIHKSSIIGKYLKQNNISNKIDERIIEINNKPEISEPKKKKRGFGNFDNW
ncbi:hypothetical protein PNEG_02037 [Pneumocystis murina B123]|uniref:Peptidylprolyl isomerase n=1 Tax=Pneumocystis murina (strain B123) TaxID=1069680 RepID=M7NRX9_PNEMU|nr:hypothetical protein PNEG_02037 [Pneumocystis murina B123]EMR09856.1 hypothetical protein PNEG_02037 [Pneumocystis murina B123]